VSYFSLGFLYNSRVCDYPRLVIFQSLSFLHIYYTQSAESAIMYIVTCWVTEYATRFVTFVYLRLHYSSLQSLFTMCSDPLTLCLGAVLVPVFCLSPSVCPAPEVGCWRPGEKSPCRGVLFPVLVLLRISTIRLPRNS
jgi:hypothetical protein